jgi:NAD(P)-dependent dehydrogenase (short-subunit alcohol dehydrogenase family)
MTDLAGKTAVVTGSSRSIGAEIARTLARAGSDVVVNSRSSREEAESVAAECRAFGVRSTAVVSDVSRPGGVDQLARATFDQHARVDILINTVGVSPRVAFLDMSFEDWNETMSINANSMFLTCKAFVPSMAERRWGRIVNMSGHAYLHIHGTGVHTKASKAAVMGLTRGLAGELARFNITANHIAPSLIDTPERRNKYYRDNDPKWDPQSRGVDKVPLKRLGKTSEVAGLVRFLCSEDGAYMTGQTFLVNGGLIAV